MVLALVACGSAATASLTTPPTAASTAAPTPAHTAAPAATLASATAAPSSPAPATQPQTIHLNVHPINDTMVPVGSLTGCTHGSACQGDYMIGYDPAFDVTTGKEVGTLAYECFLVDPASIRYHCPGNTITLTDRGQIVFAEVIEHEVGRPPAVAPITGGTGEFLGATGTVTAKVLSGAADLVIAISR
jgi:hypothetical protein